MMKPYALVAALLLSSTLTAAAQSQHNHSDKHTAPAQQAHLHGIAKLTLVLEGDALEISLESPAANIVGFEHQASSEKHIKAVEKARANLESSSLFLFSGSDCYLNQANIDLSSVIEPDNQQSHDHDRKQHDGHGEITANYRYECSKGEQLETLSINLLSVFPAIETMEVMWLTDNQQGAIELTAKSNLIRIR